MSFRHNEIEDIALFQILIISMVFTVWCVLFGFHIVQCSGNGDIHDYITKITEKPLFETRHQIIYILNRSAPAWTGWRALEKWISTSQKGMPYLHPRYENKLLNSALKTNRPLN